MTKKMITTPAFLKLQKDLREARTKEEVIAIANAIRGGKKESTKELKQKKNNK